MPKLGHIRTVNAKGARYEIIRNWSTQWSIEKYVDDMLSVRMEIEQDKDGSLYHTDKYCTAGSFGRHCHHITMIRASARDQELRNHFLVIPYRKGRDARN